MTTQLTVNAGQYSNKGIKEHNEDACGILYPDEPLLTTKGIACVIADGVSNAAAGREASESCVKGFLNDYFSSPESWTVKTSGQRILGALNRWLYGQGQTLFESDHGMISTLSVLVFKSTSAHIFHVGDTRIYRLRDDALECLTRDHQSWACGERAFLCRAMGADINIDIDYSCLPIEINDTYLLTTDGIHEYCTNKQIKDTLNSYANTPEKAAKKLVTLALEQGSKDNVTAQIIEVQTLPNQDVNEFYQHLTELPFPPPLEPGMILDSYKVLRELHASKRTQIYLAIDTGNNNKIIIKTPSVNYDDDAEYIDRFLHEEWAGRRIDNQHVLKVLEPPRRRRFLYYVTEYIEGQTLRQWMNDHPLASLNEVRTLTNQIVSGIRAFHRMEMIHQDIKPENIMMDTNGTVKIIDFGSTRIAGIQEINKPIAQQNLLGTLDYTAPEYFEGQTGNNRSDLYSLGVITYEMLTGKLPYGEPLSAHNLKRVRYVSATQYNPEIPFWIDSALEKAVRLDPRNRYNVMSEFTYDLIHPNPDFKQKKFVPLIESDPLAFWRGLSITLLILNILILFLLLD